jgi:hypothetical protein
MTEGSHKPDLERGIYRVTHSLVIGDRRFIVENDFIFQDGDLILVLEWAGPPDAQHPSVTLQLVPALLSECPGEAGYYTYSGELVDPRKVQ